MSICRACGPCEERGGKLDKAGPHRGLLPRVRLSETDPRLQKEQGSIGGGLWNDNPGRECPWFGI